MGDFDADTEIVGSDGHFRAKLSGDWEIWGPCGGYVAAVMLRAAGAHSSFRRPASLTCHFVGVADFRDVDLETATVRAGKRSESVRIEMRQDGRLVCHALAWTVADADGLEHDWTEMPSVPGPAELPTIEELVPDWDPWYPFWNNVEYRPVSWLPEDEWMARRPLPPIFQAWYRLRPTPVFEDPFLEAGRVTLLLDIMGWPAAHRATTPADDDRWIAPNMDVTVAFHQLPDGADALLLDGEAPIATEGLIGSTGRVWSADGRLLASGMQQMLCREIPPPHAR